MNNEKPNTIVPFAEKCSKACIEGKNVHVCPNIEIAG